MVRRLIILFAVIALIGVQSAAQAAAPSNDNFANRTKILSLPYTGVVDVSQATHEITDPAPSCAPLAVQTVWYEYFATFTGKLRTDTYGSPFDTVLAAFTDNSPIGFSEVACSDDDGPAKQSRLELDVSMGTIYYIQVGGWAISSGSLTFNVVAPYMPSNDHFANAIEVSDLPFESQPDNTNDATLEPGEPQPCYSMTRTVWFKYSPGFRRSISIHAMGSGFGAGVAIYSGTALDNLANAVCSNSNGTRSITVFPENTYYFQVGSKSGNSGGNLTFKISSPAAPQNDDFVNAVEVSSLPTSLAGNTVGATLEPNEPTPSCGADLDHTVWYRMVASASEPLRAEVSSFSIIGIYQGDSLANLEQITCDDDWGGSTRVNFHATAGATYYFQLGGWYRTESSFTFSLRLGLMPANDDFINATIITSDVATIAGNNESATWEQEEPTPPDSCTYPPVKRSIWYKFTPPIDGTVRADTSGTKFPNVLAAYTGDVVTNLQQVTCNDWQGYGRWMEGNYDYSRLDFQITAGTTYYFQLSSEYGYAGNTTLNFKFHPFTRTEMKTYVLGLPYYSCPSGGPTCIGGGNFQIRPDDASISITLQDASTLPVPGIAEIYNAQGQLMGWEVICGSATIVPVPDNASQVSIWVNGWWGSIYCLDSIGKIAHGTTGTIKVDFK